MRLVLRAPPTLSVGLARVESTDTRESILALADKAMSLAKKRGRNRVVHAESESARLLSRP
jgi:PleD family two-component response regulator